MRIISERVLDVKEEMCLCFIDWQKAFDRVDWTKLLEMPRNIGVNCASIKEKPTVLRLEEE